MGDGRVEESKAAIGAVHVQPHRFLAADLQDLTQRIDRRFSRNMKMTSPRLKLTIQLRVELLELSRAQ